MPITSGKVSPINSHCELTKFSPHQSNKLFCKEMKTHIVLLFGTFAMLANARAQHEPAIPIAKINSLLVEELREATDIAIIKKLDSGGHKIVSVIRGSAYSTGTIIHLGDFIRSDMQQESSLLVWEKNYIGDTVGTITMKQSVESLPISEEKIVTLQPSVFSSLKDLLQPETKKQNKSEMATPRKPSD